MTELLFVDKREQMGAESLSVSQRITDTSPQYQHLYQQIYLNSFHVKTDEQEKK